MQFKFSGVIFEWRGPAPFYFIALPDQVADEIKSKSAVLTYGWGVIPVTMQIAQMQVTTSLIPRDGGYYLPVKREIRLPLDLQVNQTVEVLLTV
ncbi:MAG: hypothetical protein RL038_520 [Actinomycetota bacterium]